MREPISLPAASGTDDGPTAPWPSPCLPPADVRLLKRDDDASHLGRVVLVTAGWILEHCGPRLGAGRALETLRVAKEALARLGRRTESASQIRQTGAGLGASAGRRMALDMPRVPRDIREP